MGIEGKLQDIGLADICQLLAMGRKTGCLSVTDRSNFGYIYFDQGLVAHATVLNRRDRLGELLVRNDVVSAGALERARGRVREARDTHYAAILLEEGELSRGDLERYQTVEVQEAVYQLFAWDEGSFHFAPDEVPDGSVPLTVTLPAENLLLEGARRVDERSRIERVVTSPELVFRIAKDPRDDPDSELPPEQVRVLDLLDGRRSVNRVVRDSGMVEFDVAHAIHEMVGEGWVEATETAPPPEERATEEPGEEDALALGHAFYRTGMFREAEREYLRCLEADPPPVEALDRLALVALRDGKHEVALEYLDRADGAGEPDYARDRNRALVLETAGNVDEALELLDRAAELAPGGEDGDLRLQRGIALLKAHRPEEALHEFRAAGKAAGDGEPPDPIFYAHAILAAAMAGEPDEAIRLGREGLTVHPWSGPILVNLGAVLERRGEPAAAEALYLRAVGESRTPAQAHRNLGDLALRRGDHAAARGHYERAVRLDPDLGDNVFLLLGNLFYREGNHDTARRLWKRALQIEPENEVARTNLGLVGVGGGP